MYARAYRRIATENGIYWVKLPRVRVQLLSFRPDGTPERGGMPLCKPRYPSEPFQHGSKTAGLGRRRAGPSGRGMNRPAKMYVSEGAASGSISGPEGRTVALVRHQKAAGPSARVRGIRG